MSNQAYFRDNPAYTNYFTVRNTTPGTGIAGHAAPTTADNTKPVLYMFNGSANSRLYLDYVRIRLTAIGAGATTTDCAVFLDHAGATTRSGGGTQVTPVCNTSVPGTFPNGIQATSLATVFIGPVVTVPVASKQVASHRVRSVVPVVEDQYFFAFNPEVLNFTSTGASTGTAVYQATIPMPPVVVGPLDTFEVVIWGASESGAHSFDIEAGWYER